jgi:hypothetical protein
MNSLWIACLMTLAGVDVRVQPLSGDVVRGQLTEIREDAVIVVVNDDPQTFPAVNLWQITAVTPDATPEDMTLAWVRLIDGSLLLCREYVTSGGSADVRLTTGDVVKVPTRSIHSVRFRDHSQEPKFAEQWEELTSQKPSGDRIIIRRAEGLDHLEGIVREVTAETVPFEFEGQQIAVNRAKLDGLMYYHPALGELPERKAEVVDASGSRWNVKSLQIVDDRLECRTVAGVTYAPPLTRLTRIDFSSGNTVWLEELQPEAEPYVPYIESSLSDKLLREFLHKSVKRLEVGGQVFARGLTLFSGMTRVYRLTEEYRQLHAVVGLDDNASETGAVKLTIYGDDRVLFNETVRGQDPPRTLDLEITGVRRLKIVVDYGDGGDVGDQLDLCDARLTK